MNEKTAGVLAFGVLAFLGALRVLAETGELPPDYDACDRKPVDPVQLQKVREHQAKRQGMQNKTKLQKHKKRGAA